MSKAFIIRAARPGDEDAILEMLWAFAQFEKLTHIFNLAREIIARDFIGPNARVNCEVAECDGKLAGLMIWYRTYGTFEATPYLYLEDVYVMPEFRLRGIGRAFLKRLAQQAIKEGTPRIDWIVLDWNTPAIEFYHRIGAKLAEEWRMCRITGTALANLAEK